jgi:Cofactor assembly of complex C subunit B
MPIDERAKQIFAYFKQYNYNVKSTGEVITFEGNYKASISKLLIKQKKLFPSLSHLLI